jgi:Family of unknown function (DUF6152)
MQAAVMGRIFADYRLEIVSNRMLASRQSLEDGMRNRSAVVFILFFSFAIISLPLLAHHGNAAYDYEKTVTIKGTVAAWIFANPHSLMKLDVADDKGEVQHWVLEGNAASLGGDWHKSTVKPGDAVTVEIMPPKNGAQAGRIRRILRPDGTVVVDAHLPSTLNDVAPPKNAPKPTADSNSDGSR